MKKVQHTILLLFASALAVSCGAPEVEREAQPADTYYTIEKAGVVYYQDPQQAFSILDSAEIVGNATHTQADIMRARFYSYDEATKDTARTICMQLLAEGGLKAEEQANLLEVLVYVACMKQDDEGMLKYGTQYIEVCRKLGEQTSALVTQSEIGNALIRLGRTNEGFAKMDDAIAQLDKARKFNEMDACIRAMKRKISTLCDLERYEEVIPVAGRIVEKINDYGEHPDDYADGSDRMPTEERRPGYIDFYTGQAYAFMAYAYAMMDSGHSGKSGFTGDAKRCLALFEQTAYSNTFGGKKMISSTWCLLGQYDKMLAFYDELQPLWDADTLHSDYAIMLRNRAAAARAKGDFHASDAYMQRYSNLMKKLNDSERLATAQEYAARYHEKEQQLALEQEQNAKKRLGLLVVSLGIIALVAIVSVVIILRQLQSIRKKNAVLSKEIGERIAYEEKYLHSVDSLRLTVDSATQDGDSQLSTVNYQQSTQKFEELTDSELFDYIRKVVSEENLHLDPQFGRDQLVERLQLSKERIGAAFAQGSEYGNISNFLNDVRLFHSTKLLTEHPEMPIAEVAAASGFSNRVTFSRNFKERFAMTPSEFRIKN